MAKLFVLEVPEFAPLVRACKQRGHAMKSRDGYVMVSSPGELIIDRAATGLGEAVWFGALTGGFEGRVVEFNAIRLKIAD